PGGGGTDERLSLDISGMSCAACAHRIEHKLNKLDGVSASVNYATERAVVRGVDDPADALEVIRGAGYDAAVRHEQDAEWSRRAAGCRTGSRGGGWTVAALCRVRLMAVGVVPALGPQWGFPGGRRCVCSWPFPW